MPRLSSTHRNHSSKLNSAILTTANMRIWWTFVAKSTFENFTVVGTQPKVALVDTFSHTLFKTGKAGLKQ